MFQFPHLPPGCPGTSQSWWVAPFGYPRLYHGCSAPHRGLSQLCHALLRPQAPRHPPCALTLLPAWSSCCPRGKIEVLYSTVKGARAKKCTPRLGALLFGPIILANPSPLRQGYKLLAFPPTRPLHSSLPGPLILAITTTPCQVSNGEIIPKK